MIWSNQGRRLPPGPQPAGPLLVDKISGRLRIDLTRPDRRLFFRISNLMKFAFPPALAACVLAAAPALATPPPVLPVEVFFDTPAMSGIEFSPDGKRLLCLVPFEGRQNLAVIDLEKGTKNLLSSFKDKDVSGPFWANDERILFSVDDAGKEEFEFYAVNPDGSDPTILAPGRSTSILRRLPDDKRFLLVQAAITNNDWWDVAKMDLKTGKLSTPVAKAPGNVEFYVLDRANVVRLAVVRDWTTNTNRVLYRESDGQEWREIASCGFDQPGWEPIAFDGDNRTLFVWSDIGRKTRAVYRYDTATGTLESTPVFGDDTYDVQSVIYDESKQKVVGITYPGDRRRFHWLDDEFKAIHARIEQSLPDTVHSPTQISADASRILFYSYSDRDPGVYYLYDRKRQKLSELAVIKPKVDPGQMSVMKPVTYQARDGLTLHGYLTLPAGREAKDLPLIIHPHGGPYGPRDNWGFNAEVQFYANRGFAVLQVDFRGSGGYGQWFEAAGFKRWGLEMQDDLTDGVKWSIAQGVADPKRIVISGASYGGYATMAGLVYTPELYAAGINYVGVVDIRNLIPKTAPARRLHWMHTRLGNLANDDDRKRIHETSPVNFPERIRVPVLMAYGSNDPRVRIDQANDIERALKRSKVPYELIIERDEGHGFRKEQKRIAFYSRIDSFLKKYVTDDTSLGK